MRYFFGSLHSRKERQCHYVLHRPFSTKNFVFIFCNPLASHTSNQSPRFSNSLIRLTLFELLLYIAHRQCLISAFNVSSYLAFRERSRDVPRFCTLSDQILSVPHWASACSGIMCLRCFDFFFFEALLKMFCIKSFEGSVECSSIQYHFYQLLRESMGYAPGNLSRTSCHQSPSKMRIYTYEIQCLC